MAYLGVGAQVARGFFITFNAVFVVLGILDLVVGVYVVVNTGQYDDAESITGGGGGATVAGGAVMIGSGAILVLLCGAGIVGAVCRNRPILIVYSVILGIIVIIQIIVAIVGIVNINHISSEVKDNLQNAIKDYRAKEAPDYDETAAKAVDYLQNHLKCCGVDNFTDYVRFNEEFFCSKNSANDYLYGPPDSCRCDPLDDDDCGHFESNTWCSSIDISFSAWEDGCQSILEDALKLLSVVMVVIYLIFAIVEIIMILLGMVLVVAITSGKTYTRMQ